MPFYVNTQKPDSSREIARLLGKCIIDASLGDEKHLGYVTIGNGSLYPGAAVQKDLPPVGDIYITGIVNIAGILEYLTLQTTRLSTVITLADTITQGILGNFI